MPNFPANLLDIYHGRSFDPDTNLAAPYQSGMTGIMLDQKKTGPQDSLAVLFSDQFAGKMTYLDEWRDTIGLSALNLGDDPATLTQEQFDASLARSRPRSRTSGSARSRATSTRRTWPPAARCWRWAGPAT